MRRQPSPRPRRELGRRCRGRRSAREGAEEAVEALVAHVSTEGLEVMVAKREAGGWQAAHHCERGGKVVVGEGRHYGHSSSAWGSAAAL